MSIYAGARTLEPYLEPLPHELLITRSRPAVDSSSELRELMASVGECPSDDELAEMIRIADADGTGDIDFVEFVTLMAHKMNDEKSEETLKAAFAVFDTSGDGYISAEEMRRIMINVGEPVTLEDITMAMKKIDDDGDGVIDFNE